MTWQKVHFVFCFTCLCHQSEVDSRRSREKRNDKKRKNSMKGIIHTHVEHERCEKCEKRTEQMKRDDMSLLIDVKISRRVQDIFLFSFFFAFFKFQFEFCHSSDPPSLPFCSLYILVTCHICLNINRMIWAFLSVCTQMETHLVCIQFDYEFWQMYSNWFHIFHEFEKFWFLFLFCTWEVWINKKNLFLRKNFFFLLSVTLSGNSNAAHVYYLWEVV